MWKGFNWKNCPFVRSRDIRGLSNRYLHLNNNDKCMLVAGLWLGEVIQMTIYVDMDLKLSIQVNWKEEQTTREFHLFHHNAEFRNMVFSWLMNPDPASATAGVNRADPIFCITALFEDCMSAVGHMAAEFGSKTPSVAHWMIHQGQMKWAHHHQDYVILLHWLACHFVLSFQIFFYDPLLRSSGVTLTRNGDLLLPLQGFPEFQLCVPSCIDRYSSVALPSCLWRRREEEERKKCLLNVGRILL